MGGGGGMDLVFPLSWTHLCVYVTQTSGPAEMVGQVGHLPYHFLVVHTGNDVYYDFYPR